MGCWDAPSLSVSGTFFAASPIISSARVTACSGCFVLREILVTSEMAGETPGIQSHQECAGDKRGHPSIQITSRSTRERMYLSTPPAVRRSTFLVKEVFKEIHKMHEIVKCCLTVRQTQRAHPHHWNASARCGQRTRISRSFSHRTVYVFPVMQPVISGIPDFSFPLHNNSAMPECLLLTSC